MVVEMRNNSQLILVWLGGGLLFGGAIFVAAITSVVAGLLLAALGVVWVRNGRMIYGRKLEFQESGCTIWSRDGAQHIRWEDMAVKRIEPQHFGMNNGGYLWGGAFFSLCPTKKSPRKDPSIYAMWHPRTCFWVYFRPEKQDGTIYTPGVYEVDKEKFLTQLKEWGVELEHIRY